MIYFYHLILRLHSGFASCPILSFIQNQFITESHYILFSCFFNQFLSLSLAFMTDILNIVGQLFCIMFLNLEYQKEILSDSAWFWLHHYSWCQSHVSDGVFQISKVTHLPTPHPVHCWELLSDYVNILSSMKLLPFSICPSHPFVYLSICLSFSDRIVHGFPFYSVSYNPLLSILVSMLGLSHNLVIRGPLRWVLGLSEMSLSFFEHFLTFRYNLEFSQFQPWNQLFPHRALVHFIGE